MAKRKKLKRYWWSDSGSRDPKDRTSPFFKSKSDQMDYFYKHIYNRPHGSSPINGEVDRELVESEMEDWQKLAVGDRVLVTATLTYDDEHLKGSHGVIRSINKNDEPDPLTMVELDLGGSITVPLPFLKKEENE